MNRSEKEFEPNTPNIFDGSAEETEPKVNMSALIDLVTSSGRDPLKLEYQLCFPLYAASREVTRRYRTFLDELGLTYTQYITMMVLWECKTISSKDLGQKLYLDSGTLTPLLKSMEAKGLLTRERAKSDERLLLITITEQGEALKEAASSVPGKIAGCVNLSPEEGMQLYKLLYKILER